MTRLATLFLFLAPLLAAQTAGIVEGFVVNRVSGVGIGGVAVVLYTGQAISYAATTDGSGRFRATGMRPGAYRVRYEKDRFKPYEEEPISPYRIESGNAIQLLLEMTPLVTLRGRVLNVNGQPALRAQVRISTFFALVDERGEFEFDQLEPGSYIMLAIPGPVPPALPSTQDRVEPVQTFFPSAVRRSEARRIVVRGDADLSGYEIRLQSVAMHRIRGVVRDETGKPASAAVRLLEVVGRERQVLLRPGSDYFVIAESERADGLLQASTTTGDDGSFEFPSVPAGDWRIAVDAGIRPDQAGFSDAGQFGQAAVSVGRSDVDDLEIGVRRVIPFALHVVINWDDAPAAIIGADAPLSTLPGRKVRLPDGTIRLENVRPGSYRILPLPERAYYPVSALLGGREVFGHDVELLDGSPELRIFYKAVMGSVKGMVQKGATVVLLPKQINGAGFGRVARCDSLGNFSIDSVLPGDYYLSAFEQFDRSFLMDPGLLEEIAARGASVTIGESPLAGVKLTTIRWPE